MNLLVKKLKAIVVALLLPLFFVSCEDPGKIGLDINPENSVIIAKYKEFILPSSQVQFNPRSTSKSSFFQAGSYADTDLGTIHVKSYSWIGIQPTTPTISEKAKYAGVSMSIQFSSIYGNEAEESDIQSFGIYQLAENLVEDKEYTRVDELQLGSLLGTAEILIQENDTLQTDSTFQVDLNDEFGQIIFDKLLANDPIFDSESNFNEFINGIAIIPSANSNKVVQFNTLTFNIGINYTEVNSAGETVERSYDLGLGSQNFYHIDSDLSGTPLDVNHAYNEEFEAANNYRYLQAGTLISLKLDLNPVYDYINDELKSDSVSNIIVQKAELSLGDVSINKPGASYPFSLYGYFTDSQNTWPAISESSADSTFVLLQIEAIASGAPTYPGYYGAPQELLFEAVDSLKYDATMSNFFQNLLSDGYNTDDTPLEQGGEMFLFVPTNLGLPQSSPSHSQTNFFKVHQDSIRIKLHYSVTNF